MTEVSGCAGDDSEFRGITDVLTKTRIALFRKYLLHYHVSGRETRVGFD